MEKWRGKRYYSLKAYFNSRYTFKVQRIPVHAGFSCPNRDGTISDRGCLFCNNEAFSRAAARGETALGTQVVSGMAYARRRFGAEKFIIYFQTYSNTYASFASLKAAYDQAAAFPDVIGLSIGTRPDCIDEEKLGLLKSYGHLSELWIEFGIQTAQNDTLKRINRGHHFETAVRAVRMAAGLGLNVVAHIILGLPGETVEDMRKTAEELSALPLGGVKIHQLHVVSGTPLETCYRQGNLALPGREEYIQWVCDVLERLSPSFVIHRLAGESSPEYLVAPLWRLGKQEILAQIDRELTRRNTCQGALFNPQEVHGPE